jgi:four helix bundle protein
MKILKFEDIEAWQEARRLVNMVYDLTSKIEFKKDFGLKEQIQRATVSCMSNIAEGFDSGSDQQFIQYLVYTRRSSSEVQSQLYAALDRKYIFQNEFNEVYEQAKRVAKLSNGFIKYLRTGRTGRPVGQADRPTGRQEDEK